MYQTVDINGQILETWETKEEVNPTIDYHEIQHVRARWSSLYGINQIPF